MSCPLCASGNQAEFRTEMIIHFTGLENVNKPGVLLFPKVLVCLDCGFLGHTVPARELALLSESTSKSECPADKAVYSGTDGVDSISQPVPN
jgi:hypothetical protein